MCATPLLALQWAVTAMVPVLLRDHFAATEWQTMISTAAIPVMSVLAIFWNELYRRVSARRYLLILWTVAVLPLAGLATAHRPLTALTFIVISAVGFGAMAPMTADILRSCYPPSVRSRSFGLLQVVAQATLMVATYGIGVWLDVDAEAFRVYLPMGVVLIGLGMMLLSRITRQPLFAERHRSHPTEPLRTSVRAALRDMGAVLVHDRNFRRYEIAFFTYGLGWMICYSLVPFLVVDVLKLNYEEVAFSTQTAFQLTLIVMIMPTGHLMDRLGPIRTASWAFATLAFYPIGLMLAHDAHTLTLATLVWGMGLSGVQLAWTIGPVTLAPDASQAPRYLAIHGTLVGFRALLGQTSAVAFYRYTDWIYPPLVVAIALFATGSILMHRLARDHRAESLRLPAVPVGPVPPAESRAT